MTCRHRSGRVDRHYFGDSFSTQRVLDFADDWKQFFKITSEVSTRAVGVCAADNHQPLPQFSNRGSKRAYLITRDRANVDIGKHNTVVFGIEVRIAQLSRINSVKRDSVCPKRLAHRRRSTGGSLDDQDLRCSQNFDGHTPGVVGQNRISRSRHFHAVPGDAGTGNNCRELNHPFLGRAQPDFLRRQFRALPVLQRHPHRLVHRTDHPSSDNNVLTNASSRGCLDTRKSGIGTNRAANRNHVHPNARVAKRPGDVDLITGRAPTIGKKDDSTFRVTRNDRTCEAQSRSEISPRSVDHNSRPRQFQPVSHGRQDPGVSAEDDHSGSGTLRGVFQRVSNCVERFASAPLAE